MRAATVRSLGSAEGITITDVPEPVPGAGEVLVEVEAIGVGGVDALLRRRTIPGVEMPAGYIPGSEVAGVVAEAGAGIDRSWIGRRVWAFTGLEGAYAERATAAAVSLVELPTGLSPVAAVTLGSAAAVAHFGLLRARFAPGERVLVRGAAGSIGVAAVQLAAGGGAAVVAVTTSSAERGERLRALGATHVLDRAMAPLPGAVGSPPTAYDVILDVAGGPDLAARVALLAPNGRLIQVGAVAGHPEDGFTAAVLSAFQRSVTVGTLSLATIDPAELARARAELFDAARRGTLHAVIDDTLPLAEAATAHHRLDAGEVFGRLVLTP